MRILLLLICAMFLQAQPPWTGILASSRAIDWSGAGVVGGIPSYPACTSGQAGVTVPIAAYSGTAAKINTALVNCASANPSGSHLDLASGTFILTTGVDMSGLNNIVLRGQGASATVLSLSTAAYPATFCNGATAIVCAAAGDNTFPNGEQNVCDWTAGYSPGTQTITLSNCGSTTPSDGSLSNLHVGSIIVLDQVDLATDPGTIWPCVNATTCSQEGNGSFARTDGTTVAGVNIRSQQQVVSVTAISGSTISISSGLSSTGIYMPNWTSTQKPQAWFASHYAHGNGVENLGVDTGGVDVSDHDITITTAYNCWIKGVTALNAVRSGITLNLTSHITVQDSYLYQNTAHLTQSYALERNNTSDSLVQNNIFQQVTDSSPTCNGGCEGNVAFANFATDTQFAAAGWFQGSYYIHASGSDLNLDEENIGSGTTADDIHGTHHFTNYFRNFYPGYQDSCDDGADTCTTQTVPVNIYAGNRYFSFIGGVYGTPGYHTQYDCKALATGIPCTNGNVSVYALGQTASVGTSANTAISGYCTTPACLATSDYDPQTVNYMMRWGNWDVVNAAAQFNSSEVPSGLAVFSNPVPSSHTLPASFFLTSKPSWWGSLPWPAIGGPDVTSGGTNVVIGQCSGGTFDKVAATKGCSGGSFVSTAYAGRANVNPAMSCAVNTLGMPADGSGGPLAFDANECYQGMSLDAPTFSVGGGSYSNTQTVTLTPPSGANACWNNTGSPAATTPGSCDSGSTLYTGPITVAANETIYALSTESAQTNSSVVNAAYVILVVSNVQVTSIPSPNGALTHSAPLFTWDVSTSAPYHRVILTNTATTLTNTIENVGSSLNDLGWAMGGLAANTAYTYSVQSSLDGTNWSNAVTGSYSTAVLPFPHPAPPQIPASALWTPTYPITSGYLTATVGSGCTSPSLQSLVNTAVTNQPTNGTVISIPEGIVCPGVTIPNDTQVMTVPSFGVNTSTGVFTYSAIPSGFHFANGQAVKLFSTTSCLPGASTQGAGTTSFKSNGCYFNGPLTLGVVYYMVSVSGSTFKLSATPGGSPIVPGDQGTGTTWVQQWPPQNSNWIVIQTSTPDSSFCPFGVRCLGSIWAPKMAIIQSTGGVPNGANNTVGGFMTHHLWFRGIEWTTTDVASLASSTIDPPPSGNLINFPYSWVSNFIVFDRDYFIGQNFPNRYSTMLTIGGSYIAFLSSDFENFEYWRPNATPALWNGVTQVPQGLNQSRSGQVITIIPGSIKAPNPAGLDISCTASSNMTFTVTGGSSSTTAVLYIDRSCVPTLRLPTGMTASCTGSMTDANASSHACSVPTPVTTPDWPRDGSGGVNAFTLAQVTLSGGSITGLSNQQPNQSVWLTEGTQMVQQSAGPGPVTICNNYIESTGLLWHFGDDSSIDPVGVYVCQNTFFWNQAYKMGSPSSTGYQYYQRNGMEFKHGRQIKFEGNIALGSWASVSGTGPAFLAHIGDSTPGTQPRYTIQDVDIKNNTFWDNNVCFEFGGGESLGLGSAVPAAARIRVKNNICNTNGFLQTDGVYGEGGNGGASGNPLELDSGIEDLIVDHNMFYDNRGTSPVIWHAQVVPMEGCLVTNNFFWFNQGSSGFTAEADGTTTLTPSISGSGSTLFNKMCTNDPNTPGGVMVNNVGVPYYSTSGPGAPTSLVPAQSICTALGGGTMSGTSCPGGLISRIMNQSTAPLNLAQVGLTNTSALNAALLNASALKLVYNAPCISGSHCTTDGTDMGPDILILKSAQGSVSDPVVIAVGTTTATITWVPSDPLTAACPLDYSTNEANLQTGGGRAVPSVVNGLQTVSLSGLTPATKYYFRVLCPVQQPMGVLLTK